MFGGSRYAPFILPLVFALPAWYWLRRRSKGNPPRPPGPKGYPFIGNILDFPTGVPPWEGFTSMAKQYGEI